MEKYSKIYIPSNLLLDARNVRSVDDVGFGAAEIESDVDITASLAEFVAAVDDELPLFDKEPRFAVKRIGNPTQTGFQLCTHPHWGILLQHPEGAVPLRNCFQFDIFVMCHPATNVETVPLRYVKLSEDTGAFVSDDMLAYILRELSIPDVVVTDASHLAEIALLPPGQIVVYNKQAYMTSRRFPMEARNNTPYRYLAPTDGVNNPGKLCSNYAIPTRLQVVREDIPMRDFEIEENIREFTCNIHQYTTGYYTLPEYVLGDSTSFSRIYEDPRFKSIPLKYWADKLKHNTAYFECLAQHRENVELPFFLGNVTLTQGLHQQFVSLNGLIAYGLKRKQGYFTLRGSAKELWQTLDKSTHCDWDPYCLSLAQVQQFFCEVLEHIWVNIALQCPVLDKPHLQP